MLLCCAGVVLSAHWHFPLNRMWPMDYCPPGNGAYKAFRLSRASSLLDAMEASKRCCLLRRFPVAQMLLAPVQGGSAPLVLPPTGGRSPSHWRSLVSPLFFNVNLRKIVNVLPIPQNCTMYVVDLQKTLEMKWNQGGTTTTPPPPPTLKKLFNL
jgi:hypothetical protein